MKLREFKLFDRFDPDGEPVYVCQASSPIHALDLFAVEKGFSPYSRLITDEESDEYGSLVYEHDGKLWAIYTNTEVFVHLPAAEEVAGSMLFRAAVERGKREILEDVVSGKVPIVSTFAELHSHVDANEYAGLCSAVISIDEDHEFANAVQDALHRWIATGELRREADSVPMGDKIKHAAGTAELVFWAKVSEFFPEIETGDLDPLTSHRFSSACEDVVKAWLRANHPVLSRLEIDPVL